MQLLPIRHLGMELVEQRLQVTLVQRHQEDVIVGTKRLAQSVRHLDMAQAGQKLHEQIEQALKKKLYPKLQHHLPVSVGLDGMKLQVQLRVLPQVREA